MIQSETKQLMDTIALYYPAFTFDQKIFTAWHRILKEYEYSAVETSLLTYVRSNDFPPKINQLLRGINKNDNTYNVPSREQTLKMFDEWDAKAAHAKANQLSQEEIDKVLEETAGAEFLAELKKRRNKR